MIGVVRMPFVLLLKMLPNPGHLWIVGSALLFGLFAQSEKLFNVSFPLQIDVFQLFLHGVHLGYQLGAFAFFSARRGAVVR